MELHARQGEMGFRSTLALLAFSSVMVAGGASALGEIPSPLLLADAHGFGASEAGDEAGHTFVVRDRNPRAAQRSRKQEIPTVWAARVSKKTDPLLLMSVDSLQRELREGRPLCLVDVRNSADYEKVQIPGAVRIPMFALKSKEILKTQPIVLLGSGYDYSLLEPECRNLREQGFMVSILEGGLCAWKARGLPLEGMGTADLSLQTLSPADFFRERHMDHWLFLNLCASAEELASDLIPEAVSLVHPGKPPELAGRLDGFLRNNTEITDKYLLIFDEDGRSYPSIRSELRKTKVQHVFYLDGGIQGYRAFIQQQLALNPSGPKSAPGTERSCPGCP